MHLERVHVETGHHFAASANFSDMSAWFRLIYFPSHCLQLPKRGGQHRNLANQVNQLINAESPCTMGTRSLIFSKPVKSTMHLLANRVSSKLEECVYKGVVHIASSVDSLAEYNSDTLAILKEKYPSP